MAPVPHVGLDLAGGGWHRCVGDSHAVVSRQGGPVNPDQISNWLSQNLHRFDGPEQWLGNEPGAARKDWDSASVRTLLAASWPYFHACLTGDSVVLANGYGPVRMESLSPDVSGLQVDCAGVLEPVAGAYVNGVRDVVKVSCKGGFAVTCTPDHRIKVARPAQWRKHGPSRTALARQALEEWVPAGELSPGDVLKTYYGQNIWAAERVQLSRPDRPGSRVSYPEVLDEDLAWLLGLMATDCSVRWQHGPGMSAAIRWSADDPGVLARLEDVIPRVFGKAPCIWRRSGCSAVAELASTPLVAWLRDVFGTDRRRVPDAIFRSPRPVVAAYLRGLFDGDGEVRRGKSMPGAPKFSNSEESLVRDVYVLLMNMGAPVSVHRQEPPQTALTEGHYVSWRPVWRLHALWAADMDWDWLEFSHEYRQAGLGAWRRYQPVLLGRCKADGGVAFCEVTAVEPAGEAQTYDLNVPATESFTANALVVHNSGNMSVPAVYAAISKSDRGNYLADRCYLPLTKRDMTTLEKSGLGVFGIESRREAREFDIVATSISYIVLLQNFHKQLQISGIPTRRTVRQESPERWPFILIGGQSYADPEPLAAIADCIWCGEVEDEPGNPGGISDVLAVIERFKRSGQWDSDRPACYKVLAVQFNHLYFPRFIDVEYAYRRRPQCGPETSKQVIRFHPHPGITLPITKRFIHDVNSIPPLTELPLLYSDPGFGAGDLEAQRGCPAWCSFPLAAAEPIVTRDGVVPIDQVAGECVEVWTTAGWRKAEAQSHGVQQVQRITFAPASPSGWGKTATCEYGHSREGEISSLRKSGRSATWAASDARGRCIQCRRLRARNDYYKRTGRPEKVVQLEPLPGWQRYVHGAWRVSSRTAIRQQVVATPTHGWELIDGTETHDLQVGDVVPAAAVTDHDQDSLDYKQGWVHGMVFGDGSKAGGRHRTGYRIRLHGEKDMAHLDRFREALGWGRDFQAVSITYPHHPVSPDGEPAIWLHSETLLKKYPAPGATPDYLAGFLDGWLAADSSGRSDGTEVRRLYSQRSDARAWLDRYAAAAGWVLAGHSVHDTETNFGPRSASMNQYTLIPASVERGWKVVSIESLPDPVEVFCLEVPGTHRFTLAAGITTMNCRLSWSTKPFRQRSVPYMRAYAEEFQRNMGSVELSPFGPDFPFGTNKKRVLAELLQVNEHVDSSTMRVDDFIADKDFILLSAIGGMDTVTLGLEGNCLARKENVFIPGRGVLSMEEAAAAGSGFQVSCGAHAYPVRRAWKSGERDLVRVRFSDGRWLTCTPEHRIAVTRPDTSRHYNGQREALDCGSAEWVQAADLVPGERVRTFYGQECWGPAQPLLPVHVPRAGQAASRRLELPPVLTPELAWLLGLLVTDGNMTPNSARWHVDDDGVEARVREYCQELFGREPTVDRGRSVAAGGARTRRLNISSRPLVRWLELNFGLRKGDCRKVPRQVRQGSREVAQAFITGVFDGDGWVGREDPQRLSWGISQAGECEDFHRDLMALLANLGLHCTRRRQEPGGEWGNQHRWSLRVSAEDGYDWDWFRPAESSRAAAWHPPLSPRKKVLWMAPAEGHAYAEVVSVDPLEGASHPVYDIEVPETAAFTAGGVVVHNSQRMRDLVGKGTSDKEVEEAVTRGIRAGIRRFKLYMITNLPGEEEGDVMRIVALAERLAAIRDSLGQPGVRIQFSWTPLLVEANTPFQWFAPTAADHTLIKVADRFRDLGIDFKIGDLADSELVLTPDRGQVPISELAVGDLIVDPQGEPSKVTGVFPRGSNEVFRLTWSDGTSVLATGNHPWDVLCYDGKSWVQRTHTTLRLQKMAEGTVPPRLVPSPGLAVQDLGSADHQLDPYLLGLLLGDGCLTKHVPQYASADPELTEAARVALPSGVQLTYDSTGRGGKVISWNLSQSDGGGRTYPRRENPVTGALRQLGLWHHKAWEKFVPEQYKYTTAAARLAVLQGLMDTDGTIQRGRAVFGSSSRQLRDDVAWLARSLGLVARTNEYDSWVTALDGSRKAARKSYRTSIWWTDQVPVFRLARKAAHPAPKSPPRKLVSVVSEGTAETRCISVSAVSERYVAGGGFVPTHNTKGDPNKLALFQLCQRASRDVGEAVVDVWDDLATATWGGVARDMRERLDAALRNRGFQNGFGDLFDERGREDLFGWEFISTGISTQLMWDTYRQMLEFAVHTDAATYDGQLDPDYHGQEWVAKCGEACQGNYCGVCGKDDLVKRAAYIKEAVLEDQVDLAKVRPVDQSSVAVRIRARVMKGATLRYVTAEHWRYAIRRAAYRAAHITGVPGSIAKRTIVFGSDAARYKDWTAGEDYVEFGWTKRLAAAQATALVEAMAAELDPWLGLRDFSLYPASSSLRAETGYSLYHLPLEATPAQAEAAIAAFGAQDYVKLTVHTDPTSYFSGPPEEINARDVIGDVWARRWEGHRLALRYYARGKAGAYQAAAAILGKPSWLGLAGHLVLRLGMFEAAEPAAGDLLRPSCEGCGSVIPAGLLGDPYAEDFCPRCADEQSGDFITGLPRTAAV